MIGVAGERTGNDNRGLIASPRQLMLEDYGTTPLPEVAPLWQRPQDFHPHHVDIIQLRSSSGVCESCSELDASD
jgi:hypothetical protein